MEDFHYYIKPKNPNLYFECEEVITHIIQSTILYRCVIQYNKYVIYWEMGPTQCLLLDNNNNIIDGYVIVQRNDILFNNKTFFSNLIDSGFELNDYI